MTARQPELFGPRHDPYWDSVAVLVTLWLAGLVSIGAAWRGAAAQAAVALQLPYVISGGIGGLCLSGFACGLLLIQAQRKRAAEERAEIAGIDRRRRRGSARGAGSSATAARALAAAVVILFASSTATLLFRVLDDRGQSAAAAPGFAYPVVMAAPLAFLTLGGYLAWAMTQPVEAGASGLSRN